MQLQRRTCFATLLLAILPACEELDKLLEKAKATILSLSDEASAWAEENADLFGGPETLRNGEGDAARHQYWSCLLAVLYNEETAYSLTNAWEEVSLARGGPPHESEMDLLNNEEGIRLALSIDSGGEQARIDCALAVLENIAAGNYAVIAGDDLVAYPAFQ